MAAAFCVGDRNCSFNMVIKAMSRSPAFSEVMTKWRALAIELECEHEAVRVIGRNIMLHDWTSTDVMIAILPSWRSKSAENATLEALVNALESIGLNDVSGEVLTAFNIQNI